MIHLVGIGVDGAGSLTARACGIISRAGMLVGGQRHLGEFPDFSGERVEIRGGLEKAASSIEKYLKGGGARRVAVLATGDPLFFGIGAFLIKRFGKKSIEVVPNVSTVQEAFARVKESWAGAKVVSAHGRDKDLSALCGEAARHDTLAVFTDPHNTPARIAKAMMDAGIDGFTVHVCEALGMPEERVASGSLEKIAALRKFHPLNIMILIRDGKRAAIAPYRVGIPDVEFAHSSGMITKEEIRVITLSKLALKPGSVVWDIGAGSGSVAIEAALAVCPAAVYAFEKNKVRAKEIRANMVKFGARNLEVVEGEAPRSIIGRKLPGPDAVFVGGGGAALASILSYASGRLKPGGRLVVNAVTIESASVAYAFLKKKGWTREMVVVNLSKAKELGELSLLKANNPVSIIKGTKPC